jgi:hypothetical protein
MFTDGNDIGQYCAEAGISETAFYGWRKRYKDFECAFGIAHKLAHKWWMNCGRSGMDSKEFNSRLWQIVMKNRFGYTDARKLRVRKIRAAKTFDAQYDVVKNEISEGTLTGQEALQLTTMIATGAKIHECTTLADEVKLLKERVNAT